MSSSEFWLISAPGEPSQQETWDRLQKITAADNKLSLNYKFNLPDLKVGTLDQLVGLSDDLSKLDSFTEGVTKRVVSYFGEVLENQKDKLLENLIVHDKEMAQYLTRFQWESAKYPVKQSIRGISEIISKQVTQIDNDLKTKALNYNNLKNSLASLERKAAGSLLTKDLADIVKKEDFVLDSEYLTTVLVVVQRNMYKEWDLEYEKLSNMVVPRSSKQIFEDSENGLFTVTLFKKVVDEFRLHSREKRFIVRDFVYDEEALKAGKNERDKLIAEKNKQFGPLVRWLKINFSEVFAAWVHVKALRMFVESVLRYGLPVNFQGMLLQPQRRSEKRLAAVLNQLYGHLDSSPHSGKPLDMAEDIPALSAMADEYHPYVFFKINIDLIESSKRF